MWVLWDRPWGKTLTEAVDGADAAVVERGVEFNNWELMKPSLRYAFAEASCNSLSPYFTNRRGHLIITVISEKRSH